jgi:hypothetical protein
MNDFLSRIVTVKTKLNMKTSNLQDKKEQIYLKRFFKRAKITNNADLQLDSIQQLKDIGI